MRKILSVLIVSIVSISIFVGCLNEKLNNKTAIIEKMESKKIEHQDNNDILLMKYSNAQIKRGWTDAKEYFILRNCDDGKMVIYKNNEMLYSMDDEYLNVFLSPSGDNFVCEKIYRDKERWQLDIYKTEDGVKQETYFESKNEHLGLIQWTDEGILLRKYEGWHEGNIKNIPKLFILDKQKELKEIWDYSNTTYEICDIKENWILLKDYDNKNIKKMNLNTKEIEETNFSYESIETLYNVYFYNSVNTLVGQIWKDNSYATFLAENGEIEIITENAFIGKTIEGIMYLKYRANRDVGDIYFKYLR